MSPLVATAATASAVLFGAVMWKLVPPTPRLGTRVRPYLSPRPSWRGHGSGSSIGAVFGPILTRLSSSVGRRLDPHATARLHLRLRQAGLHPEIGDDERLARHRLRQLEVIAAYGAGGGILAFLVGISTVGVVGMVVVGGVAGWGRMKGSIDAAIEQRRLMMRIEIYTVDQVLALRVRSGGGVVQAVDQLVARGRGEVVSELAEAVRLHRAGLSASEAFGRIADHTPEPTCARTYRLLAVAEERGVDLAAGLLALAEDVRETRREAMKRAATRRRAAMLVPTIALLAPTLLLFVAAPLPYLLTGWR